MFLSRFPRSEYIFSKYSRYIITYSKYFTWILHILIYMVHLNFYEGRDTLNGLKTLSYIYQFSIKKRKLPSKLQHGGNLNGLRL
jgi:hypothetical protein